jgi:FG-GAP repeat
VRDRDPSARIARKSGRVIGSRTGCASRWRTAPAFLLSLAFSVSAAPTTIDAVRAPRERTIEVLTSEYELHEPTNASRNQQYGGQVALSGDGRTLAVADLWYYGGSEWPWYGSGAVYVYARSNGAWALQAKLEPPNARGYDFFGADIALSFNGRTLAVGAQNEGYDAPSQDAGPGAVFVFTRRHGAWSQEAMLQATNPQDAAAFGRSVEISAGGNVLAVGAPYEAASGAAPAPEAGAVYVFRRHGLQWTPQAALQAPSPQSYDQFGLGVRLSDDGRTLAVLAAEQNYATEDVQNGGWPNRNNTIYVFARSAGVWSLQAEFEGSTDDPHFGGSSYDPEGQTEAFDLSATGRTLAIASPVASAPDGGAGMIRLYKRAGPFWAPAAVTLAPSFADRTAFGLRVAMSADGRTLVATANRDEGPYGRPYVVAFSRGAAGWTQTTALESPTWPAFSSFGNALSVSAAGERMAIGSRSFSTADSWWGAVLLY